VLPPGKLKINRIKSNRSTKSHPEKSLCYPLESGLWIGLWFIKNACWKFFYTDKLMGFNPLRYSIRLKLHPGKIPGSAPDCTKENFLFFNGLRRCLNAGRYRHWFRPWLQYLVSHSIFQIYSKILIPNGLWLS
jgi:hypothetical protein